MRSVLSRGERPLRFRARPRLHGHVGVLWRARRRGVDRDDPPRARARRHFLDTADMYGAGHQRALVGRAIARAARQARARHQVRQSSREPAATAASIGNARRTSARPATRRCSGSASTRSTSTTCTASTQRADRGDGRRHGRAGAARARSATSACPRRAPQTLRRAHAVHPIAALQTEYSLWSATARTTVLRDLPRARHRVRRLQPARPRLPDRRDQDATDAGAERLPPRQSRASRRQLRRRTSSWSPRSRRCAARKGCTPAQLALAWLLAQGDDIVPIPGTRRRKYLDDNLGALDVRLSRDDLAAIAHLVPREQVAGQRYTEEGMKGVNV